jgi:hypothetical protein
VPSKIFPNWDFWFESKPSGNSDQKQHVGTSQHQSSSPSGLNIGNNKHNSILYFSTEKDMYVHK